METNVPSFFEHYMRCLCHSTAQSFQFNMFQSEGQA